MPDVNIGIDSPVGGAKTTVPFGSGGDITSSRAAPSYNIPVAPGVNYKLSGETTDDTVALSGTLSTPLLSYSQSLNSDFELKESLLPPQLNFPLGFGVNAYISLEWSNTCSPEKNSQQLPSY